jgi:hypothetical protein
MTTPHPTSTTPGQFEHAPRVQGWRFHKRINPRVSALFAATLSLEVSQQSQQEKGKTIQFQTQIRQSTLIKALPTGANLFGAQHR